MVKTPRTRHSKAERDPMTIELGPEDVSRVASAEESDVVKADIGASEAPAGPHDDPAAAESGPTLSSAGPAESPDPSPRDEPRLYDAEPAQPDAPPRETTDWTSPASSAPATGEAAVHPAARPSRGTALMAGIAGGVVAVVAGGLLQYAGIIGTPAAEGPVAPSIPPAVESDIAGLKSDIEALKAETGAGGPERAVVQELSQSVDQVRSDLAALRQTVESAGGDSAPVEALTGRIAEMESRIANLGQTAAAGSQEEIAAINERIAGIEALVKSAGEAGSAVDSRMGALEQSVSSLSAKVDSQAAQPKIALAIAASALKAAIERGAPFQPEVETFAAIAPQAPGLAELRPYAEKGLATRAEILAETDAAAKAMIAAANPPSEDAGYFERLLSSAESLVTVRPIGAVEGPGVPETVARMEVALRADDLAQALAEFDTLPEPAKVAGAAFADRIRARLSAEQLADKAIAAAMQAS